MKVPLRKISLLVVLSLTCIFAYQVYWLMGLYRSRLSETDDRIEAAMATADVREMLVRVSRLESEGDVHGNVEVSAGYQSNGTTVFKTSTNKGTYVGVASPANQIQEVTLERHADATNVTTIRTQPMDSVELSEEEGDELLRSMADGFDNFSTYMQRAMHSGLDHVRQADIAVYDSILCVQLDAAGLLRPHLTEFVQYTDSMLTEEKVVATLNSADYQPLEIAHTYSYFADIPQLIQYRVTMEPVTGVVLRQMAGILGTSFIILLVLALAFYYLIHTLIKMKTLEEMKTDFTNNMTHELKTPIAIAYAANDAMLNFNMAEQPQKAREYLTISQEQLQRLGGMVEEILAMSMERRKTLTLHKEDFPLREVLDALGKQYKLKVDKPVEIGVDIVPPDLRVVADRQHFCNMIGNLLDNAIKYSTAQVAISIKARAVDNGVEIAVTDDGIGIPADKLPFVFDKFYRVAHGNKYDAKGYGLGLFYVKSLMEKHGGSVAVTSEAGKGSTFTLRFV